MFSNFGDFVLSSLLFVFNYKTIKNVLFASQMKKKKKKQFIQHSFSLSFSIHIWGLFGEKKSKKKVKIKTGLKKSKKKRLGERKISFKILDCLHCESSVASPPFIYLYLQTETTITGKFLIENLCTHFHKSTPIDDD